MKRCGDVFMGYRGQNLSNLNPGYLKDLRRSREIPFPKVSCCSPIILSSNR